MPSKSIFLCLLFLLAATAYAAVPEEKGKSKKIEAALEEAVGAELVESMGSILVGVDVSDTSTSKALMAFSAQAGFAPLAPMIPDMIQSYLQETKTCSNGKAWFG